MINTVLSHMWNLKKAQRTQWWLPEAAVEGGGIGEGGQKVYLGNGKG